MDLRQFQGIVTRQLITMEISEVASKPPSRGLLVRKLPSELIIQTERHPPLATMDRRLLQMLENNKSSHDPEHGVPQ